MRSLVISYVSSTNNEDKAIVSTAFASTVTDCNLHTKRFSDRSLRSCCGFCTFTSKLPPRASRCSVAQSGYECLCIPGPKRHLLRPFALVRPCLTQYPSLPYRLSLLLTLTCRHVVSFARVMFETTSSHRPTDAAVSCPTWTCLVCTSRSQLKFLC